MTTTPATAHAYFDELARRSGLGRQAPPAPPPLAPALLQDIAEGIAAAEDLWRGHAQHDDVDRRPVRLLASDRWEAWVIGWTPGQHVEMHDHGHSAGVLVVVEGDLVEVTPRGGHHLHTTLPEGATVPLPLGVVHDVVATGPGLATSIHVYSPPLETMTFYDADGGPTRTEHLTDEAPVVDLRPAARALHPSQRRR
jgi:predicted metal-dependent enzyme (double-stranded beta helix superfamily)